MALFAASIAAGFAMADHYNSRRWFGAILLLASLLLGITASFRVIGPLAGLIVLGYTGYKLGWKVVAIAIPYVFMAALTAYVTWPYLWSAPVAHYIESIKTMSQFPFATLVLFWGQLYKANQLPVTYFPHS